MDHQEHVTLRFGLFFACVLALGLIATCTRCVDKDRKAMLECLKTGQSVNDCRLVTVQ